MKKISYSRMVPIMCLFLICSCSANISNRPVTSFNHTIEEADSTSAGQYASAQTEPVSRDKCLLQPLELADMCVGGVPLFCAKEAFNARFGTPDYLKTSIQAASVEYRQYCGYTFGTALFREYEDGWEWCGIYLYDTGIDGPRGIRVGDTLDRLFSVFPGEAECVTGDSVIFYRSNANDGSLIALPPSGEMIISGGEPIAVYYDFPEDPDWRDHAWDYDEYNYVYQSHVSLKFQISNRLITGIVIYTGPYAE